MGQYNYLNIYDMCDFKVDIVFINGSATKQTCQGYLLKLKEEEKGNSIYYMGPPICRYFIYSNSLKPYILLKYPPLTDEKIEREIKQPIYIRCLISGQARI